MNFDFVKGLAGFEKLYGYCSDAETLALRFPSHSAVSARQAVEFIVKFLFAAKVGYPDSTTTVFEMMSNPLFVDCIGDETFLHAMHYVRKMGNAAAHDGTLTAEEAMSVLEQLQFVVGETCLLLGLVGDYPPFEKPAAEAASAPVAIPAAAKPEKPQKVAVPESAIALYGQRLRYTKFNVQHSRDESENRKLFLEASFRESGWPVVNRASTSLPGAVSLDCKLDTGDTVDYVMYGRDNKPLAIVEYKTTSQDLVAGRMKVIATANQLAQKYGYKPIAYYTNGYHIYCIDQLGYPPRRVFQFHSLDELELLRLRATNRTDISAPEIDDTITNRDYQKNAIRATCNAFCGNRRSSLLVMATGTGKTRISISLVDVLTKANRVKNVLFLADRTSLVHQAHKNFTKLLPRITSSVYSGNSMNKDANARIIFSTYQTMINLIDDDTREFGSGRFDLIIIDEAHRSIFRKYSALFHYFDALMVGLTATPRMEENKSTYDMFHLPDGEPDYAYELEQAIKDKFLVGFSVVNKTTKLMQRGVKYDDLSSEQKAAMEDTFTDSDDLNVLIDRKLDWKNIEGRQIGRKVINLGTIDAMLNDLMTNGLKIEGGDKLGKTIIFAGSHLDAEKIVERFQTLYDYLGMDFCKVIDSQVEGSLALIDQFGVRGGLPQIAVSVDMLDTGIDVPDILNLVFFKPVGSKIKFLQMIGRGTRLAPDLFGPQMDKQGFIIFDYYGNFDYFSTHGTWSTTADDAKKGIKVVPQSLLIAKRKLGILYNYQQFGALTPFDQQYRDRLQAEFLNNTRGLNNDAIEVAYRMAWVSKYRTEQSWESLDETKTEEITKHILPLLHPMTEPVNVKTFDALMYTFEDEYVKRESEGKDVQNIRSGFFNVVTKFNDIIGLLLRITTIPEVTVQQPLLQAMLDGAYLYDEFSLERCEYVRKTLRGLMVYLPVEQKAGFIINIPDWQETPDGGGGQQPQIPYAKRATDYVANSNDVALAKLRNLDPLDEADKQALSDKFTKELGSQAEFDLWSGSRPLLPFLRVQTGISDAAIQVQFGSFMKPEILSPDQLTYMEQIIVYAKTNGDVTFTDLLKVSPFCDIDVVALFGASMGYVKQLVNGLHKPLM